MNRQIAAWTIAVVAVLGLTACSGSPGESDDTSADSSASESTPAAEASTDQSVADACAMVGEKVSAATGSLSGLDISTAMDDPQGTVDSFSDTVAAIGEAAEAVTNSEVKDATAAVYEDFGALRDLLSTVLVDKDTSVSAELAAVSSDVQESASALGALCSA